MPQTQTTRDRPELTRPQRIITGVVLTGTVLIAGIGFAGSYAAVNKLAIRKGFGAFAVAFPIGIDIGIVVCLALDLLLTWLRMPFPLLRHTAWLLTAATIAFNGAAAWPDPLGTGMHAVIPLLFVVTIEAARHAVGRFADITANRHMEGVRMVRWLLSPHWTYRLRRWMYLGNHTSLEAALDHQVDELVEMARLRTDYGRLWRWKAPVRRLLLLRLARRGITFPAIAARQQEEARPSAVRPSATGLDSHWASVAGLASGTSRPELPSADGARTTSSPSSAGQTHQARSASDSAVAMWQPGLQAFSIPAGIGDPFWNSRGGDVVHVQPAAAPTAPVARPVRRRRAVPADPAGPRGVHARVALTKEQRERADAAAQWFKAKAADPRVSQAAFARTLGRSDSWLSKAIREAMKETRQAKRDG
ncbi:DUF2637 domain-containing protein [Streptomyces erythrochromogenes]